MDVVLRVAEGPQRGAEFRFGEADNFIVGREDPSSRAHFQLKGDPHISRHHLLVEVRPPVCLVRDNGSLNRTEVCRAGESEWQEIGEAVVGHGDRIRLGNTVMEVRVLRGTGEATASGPERLPVSEPALLCVRCGSAVDRAPELDGRSLRAADFMCPTCRGEAASALEPPMQAGPPEPRCADCETSVASAADGDGRARELVDVALYLCPTCADRRRVALGNLGGHDVLRRLGRGGMGVVYLVWSPATYRLAALKQLRPLGDPDPQTTLRFLREIAMMQDLVHPNLVRLYGVGKTGEEPFFVSEYVPDGDLSQFVGDDGKPELSWRTAARVIADSLVGLGHFHMFGDKYVHRDIKPENILVRRANGSLVPKVADFGFARSYATHGGTVSYRGQYGGTPMYMPPEQFTSFSRCKPPTDVYAMGVTLYYLLTGFYPLGFPPAWQLKRGVRLKRDPVRIALEDEPRPVGQSKPDVPARLAEAVDRAVDKSPDARFQSASEFREALVTALAA